jgi:hypothetical protein
MPQSLARTLSLHGSYKLANMIAPQLISSDQSLCRNVLVWLQSASVFAEDSLFAWIIRSCEYDYIREDRTAEAIKDAIWPNPYNFYIGQVSLAVYLK